MRKWRSGRMVGGACAELPPLAPLSRESGAIPTPVAIGAHARSATVVRTNRARVEKKLSITLADFVTMCPEHGTYPQCTARNAPQFTEGKPLNPEWVEWLMGFPPGWTLIDDARLTSGLSF